MKRFLKHMMTSLTTSTARPERRTCLRVEGLEDRLALSTTSPTLSAPVSAGTVRGFIIEGGRGSDRGIIAIHTGLESPLVARGFNPQPEPPGVVAR